MKTKLRLNRLGVSFYEVINGFSNYIGKGNEYVTSNNETFAVIEDRIYRINHWDNNNTTIVLI